MSRACVIFSFIPLHMDQSYSYHIEKNIYTAKSKVKGVVPYHMYMRNKECTNRPLVLVGANITLLFDVVKHTKWFLT